MLKLTKRQKALNLTNNRCWYCGLEFIDGLENDKKPGLDHVVPRSKGGSHDLSNLVACCRSCNSSKRDKNLEEFRAMYLRRQPAYMAILHLERALEFASTPHDHAIRETIAYLHTQYVPHIFYAEQFSIQGVAS